MSYSKYYNPTNWENYPSEDTAINAARLNNIEDGVDTLDDRIVELSTDKSEVDWNQMLIAGRKIAEITINGITKDVLAPEGGGGGGGSTVTITPTITTGTKIADYVIDGYGGSLYAPNGGGGTSSLNDLNDVTITSATQGQVLKKGASDWENASLSKSDVGLGNVDNTSDLDKPISTATQTALNAKENASTVLTSTLSAGSTSLTFSNAAITTTAMYDVYADKYGLTPTDITITTGQAVLTFEAQSSNVSVKLVIR